jgi:hypothetical protein
MIQYLQTRLSGYFLRGQDKPHYTNGMQPLNTGTI